MKNTLPFPDGFEQWMLEKTWEQLNSEERRLLEDEGIDAIEYASIRSMLMELQQLESEPIAPPSDTLREKLLEAFDQGPQRERKIIPIGVWIGALATAAAALFALFFWVLPGAEKGAPEVAIRQKSPEPSVQSSAAQQPSAQTEQTPVNQPLNPVGERVPASVEQEESKGGMMDLQANDAPQEDLARQPRPAAQSSDAGVFSTESNSDMGSKAESFSTVTSTMAPDVKSSGLADLQKDQAEQAGRVNTSLGANPNLLSVLVTIY